MIKQLLNTAIEKYLDLSVCRKLIICRRRRLRQIIELHVTDKSRSFAQPRSIIVYFLLLQLSMVNYCMEARRIGLGFFNTRELFSAIMVSANYIMSLLCGITEVTYMCNSWGPFLERPGNLTGPKSYFEIKVSRK